jgi:hypothetical protein
MQKLQKFVFALNPNSTDWGQSWPCWHQIPDKILIYRIFKKIYLFLQKRILNIFELLTWHQFWRFFIKSQSRRYPATTSRFRPVLLLLQTTQARENSCRAVVHSVVRCQATFQSVFGPGPHRVGGGGFAFGPTLLPFPWCSNVAAPFWADFQNRRALLHTRQRLGEVSLHLGKQDLNWMDPGSLWTSQTPVELGLKEL